MVKLNLHIKFLKGGNTTLSHCYLLWYKSRQVLFRGLQLRGNKFPSNSYWKSKKIKTKEKERSWNKFRMTKKKQKQDSETRLGRKQPGKRLQNDIFLSPWIYFRVYSLWKQKMRLPRGLKTPRNGDFPEIATSDAYASSSQWRRGDTETRPGLTAKEKNSMTG